MKEPNAPSTGSEEKKDRIVELTPDMELRDEIKGKIIDLTNSRHSPSEKTAQSSSEPPPVQTESSDTDPKLALGTPAEVEADVDAAFDLMQDKAQDDKPVEPDAVAEVEGEDLDLSDSLNGLSMDDTAPIPPVEAARTADIVAEGDVEPELELFQEPIDEAPPAPPVAGQEDKPPDELENQLDGVGSGDTIQLTDVVLPIDLGPPMETSNDTEEKQQASTISEQEPENEADQIAADTIALDDALSEMPLDEPGEEEEEVIELVDIAEQKVSDDEQPSSGVAPVEEMGDEEEVIELTDIVTAEELEQEDDEDVIELIDMVDPAEVAAEAGDLQGDLLPELEDDNGLIELIDMVDSAEVAAEADDLKGDLLPELEDDDDLIELTDMVETEALNGLETPADIPPALTEPADDQVIRLDSVLEHVRQNKSKIVENMSQGLEEAIGDPLAVSNTAGDGIDMKEVREALGEPSELTDKELEEAIERIIRTKYTETIEKHIAAAVEKVVTREMESIKRDLMEDQDPDD